MKTLKYFFVMAILVVAGCVTDDTVFETPDNLELKNAKVPIPFKADMYAISDMESDVLCFEIPGNPDYCFLSRLYISGTATNTGKIDAEKSFYQFESAKFIIYNELPYSELSGYGKLVGANGDGIEFTFWSKQSLVDGTYFGGSEIIPETGTGKFKGCTGSFDTVGGIDWGGDGVWSKAQGYLVYE